MHSTPWYLGILILVGTAIGGSLPAPPDPGDPTLLPPAPAAALGYPCRDPQLDALPGFRTPPAGYGVVPFYWWMGDPLTRERLAWQLDQIAAVGGVSGLQVNYAHSDQGGYHWGLTYPSEPPLFSPQWWELFVWWAGECKRRGIAVSLSDYTLGMVGQGWWTDEILAAHPEMHGQRLEYEMRTASTGETLAWELPEHTLIAMAYRLRDDDIEPGTGIDLRPHSAGRTLRWSVPPGAWKVIAVYPRVVPTSIDPLHPLIGAETIARYFQRFEDHLPGESGRTLDFFFSDELDFGISGHLWSAGFAAAFAERKGYDLLPQLPALFIDIGPSTPRIRLDYTDVLVSLTEAAFFAPIFRWHRDRGMVFGCDHGGRGLDVVEFGDYFRTQRWLTGPGNDAPFLSANIVKNKVASSIAHLYERPRVWLEGFHSSGWGTSTADLTQATLQNYVHGHNLLSLHGLYYSTHGGWWEWAPPCNGFRMPYWPHMREYLQFVQRLSYLLSQGVHRCDVALLYPVATMQAGLDGQEAVDTAFTLARDLVEAGLDFDFIDDGSLARAEIRDGALQIAGERYLALVLPRPSAVRATTLEQALRFKRAGGVVLAVDGLPRATDRHDRDDPQLAALVRELCPAPTPAAGTVAVISAAIPRDFNPARPCQVLHRRIGPRDVYLVVGGGGSGCVFRAAGRVELWDAWTGDVRPLQPTRTGGGTTTLTIPDDGAAGHLVVFSPGDQEPPTGVVSDVPSVVIDLDGAWEFTLQPTLDNRWGDFRLPASPTMIGPEVSRFRYREETAANPGWEDPATDVSAWTEVTAGFGPQFWLRGPVDPVDDALAAGDITAYSWRPYGFSWRYGVEGDPGHQGYHGLKGNVSDDLLALGTPRREDTAISYHAASGEGSYYLWTTVRAEQTTRARVVVGGLPPAGIWLNGVAIDTAGAELTLPAGATPLLLHYRGVGRGHVVLLDPAVPEPPARHPLATRWYQHPGVLPFDARGDGPIPAGWYRFTAPPGLRGMTALVHGDLRAWANGRELAVAREARRDDGAWSYRLTAKAPLGEAAVVVLRSEPSRGCYGGAALPEPIALDCGPGSLELGDWSTNDGLATYSGGAWYRRSLVLDATAVSQTLTLDLGDVVASAEVRINGQPAGVRVAPPWRFDISPLVQVGENRVEILVANTLANYYGTVPTRYRGSPRSGLLGPVRILVGPSDR